MPAVAEILAAKTPTPTALGSAAIRERWSQRLREQALFSARMTLEGYLGRVQDVLVQIAEGRLDASAARLALRDKLAELGYAPEPGAEGTLRDARSRARLGLVLETNQKAAASMARLAESEDPDFARLFPAFELISTGWRRNHRTDWPQRWKAAGDAVGWQGASKTKMVALKGSPIWQALGNGAGGFRDTLGNPYPPFAFGSSYAWVHVDRLEARELGLLDEALANRAPLRRAARLLLAAATLRAIRNRAAHCPQDGAFLDQNGQCHSPKHGGAREDAKRWQEKPGRGQTLRDLACTQTEGLTFLQANAQTLDRDGKTITWPERLAGKYLEGEGRKQGADPRRLTLAKAAVATVRYPERIGRDYRGNQTFYYRAFGEDAVAVFVDNATHAVNSFMRGSVEQVRRSIGGKYFRRGK